MDIVLLLIWFLIAIGFLLSIISSSYYIYVCGAKGIDIFSKLLVALIAYGSLTAGTGFFAVITMFIRAHDRSPSSILGITEVAVGSTLLLIYATGGWLMCSFIVGRLILPTSTRN